MSYGMYDFKPTYKWADDILEEKACGLYTGCRDVDDEPIYTGDIVELYHDKGAPRRLLSKAQIIVSSESGVSYDWLDQGEGDFDELPEEVDKAWDDLEAQLPDLDDEEADARYREFIQKYNIGIDMDDDPEEGPTHTKDGLVCVENRYWPIRGIGERVNMKVIKPYPNRSNADLLSTIERVAEGYLTFETDENDESLFFGDVLLMHRGKKTYEGTLTLHPYFGPYIPEWHDGDYMLNEDGAFNGSLLRKSPKRNEPKPEDWRPEEEREPQDYD